MLIPMAALAAQCLVREHLCKGEILSLNTGRCEEYSSTNAEPLGEYSSTDAGMPGDSLGRNARPLESILAGMQDSQDV